MMTLKEAFDKYDCDKSSKHEYHTIYDRYFAPLRQEEVKILEIGVFKGASTRALLDYFPNGCVHGVDTFERVPLDDLGDLNSNDRFHAFKSSSYDEKLPKQIRDTFKNIKYDFIIDDGEHTPKANRLTFNNLSRLLKITGTYIIEDVFPWDIMTDEEKAFPWIAKRNKDYSDIQFNKFFRVIEENHSVMRFDNRLLTRKPDSHVIALKPNV